MSGGACLHGLRGLGRCLRTNADFKGYRAGVATRVGGSVRLDKGLGNIWGVTVFGGQDRINLFNAVPYFWIVYCAVTWVVPSSVAGMVTAEAMCGAPQ